MDPHLGMGARSLFDGMPPRKKAALAGTEDRISVLPDALIHNVMAFLQAQEAVQTCVLARRWRHLWKSMPVLRVTGGRPVQPLRKFMDHLLLLRDRSNIEVCMLGLGNCSLDNVPYVNLWIRHALLCQVRNLNVGVQGRYGPDLYKFPLDNLPIVSQFLAILELWNLRLRGNKFTDFSSCPSLKVLKLFLCYIDADKIYYRSLNCLTCRGCCFPGIRTRVSAPNLTSLQLTNVMGRTPLFEEMPVLVRAEVKFHKGCQDYCPNLNPGYCYNALCEKLWH